MFLPVSQWQKCTHNGKNTRWGQNCVNYVAHQRLEIAEKVWIFVCEDRWQRRSHNMSQNHRQDCLQGSLTITWHVFSCLIPFKWLFLFVFYFLNLDLIEPRKQQKFVCGQKCLHLMINNESYIARIPRFQLQSLIALSFSMNSLPCATSTITIICSYTRTEVCFYLDGVEISKEVSVKTLWSSLGVANLRKVISRINQLVIPFNLIV